MRFKLHFVLDGKNQELPLNYQYPVSAWIYKVLSTADTEFTRLLHDHGYKTENGKTFKLFTFSKLMFPKHTYKHVENSDRLQIWSRNAWLNVAFQLPEQCEKFITGLFKEQKVYIGDKVSGIEMELKTIEALKNYIPNDSTLKLKTKTPIVLGFKEESEEIETYIIPGTGEYQKLFLNNLRDKLLAVGKSNMISDNIEFNITKLHTKTELQTIKAYTREETKVRGYHYEFELTAPKEIIELGLNAGFGSMNSLGFGWCEVVENDSNKIKF